MNTLGLDEYLYSNKEAKQTLAALLSGGRIVHGILLTGEQGLGKQTFARLLAAAFLCRNADKPCMNCISCKKVLGGSHPDVITYVGEGSKSFHIETVREIRRKALIKPNEAEIKVFILANCESMTPQAQNSLLKLLEEPPEHTMIILTANQRSALLETVISRVAEIRLRPLSANDCTQRLHALFLEKSIEECKIAAGVCGGNLGKAKAMLEGESGMKAVTIARGIVDAAAENEYGVLLAAREVIDDKKLFLEVLQRLTLLCRDILAAKLGCDNLLSGDSKLQNAGMAWTKAHTMAVISAAEKAEQMLLQNVNQPLVASWLCSQIYN